MSEGLTFILSSISSRWSEDVPQAFHCEYFLGRNHRIAVNGHGVCHPLGIAAGVIAGLFLTRALQFVQQRLGTDFLPDLVERGRLRDFSLQGSLIPLERRGHVIERLRQPSNFVLRSDVDDNVAPAGGDLVRGPSLVAHAVHDGRQAAAGIHQYLQSVAGLPGAGSK